MVSFAKTGIAILVGVGIGAVSVQALRAQAKPLAYVIAEINVKNEDGFMKEFLPARAKAIADSGGTYIVRGGNPKGVMGQPPAGRVAVVQFENIDKLIAFTQSSGFKESQAIGDKYADIRIFGVEGIAR
jgi:uncharacterized protein (DUF1330 family)